MTEILTQDEINQLLAAIGPDEKESFFKKRSRQKKIQLSPQDNADLLRILSQKEINILLEKISGTYKNKTIIDKITYKLKNSKIANTFKPPVKHASDSELSPEEIAMLLRPMNNDKK